MPDPRNLVGNIIYIDKQELAQLGKEIADFPFVAAKAFKFLRTIDFNFVNLFFKVLTQSVKDKAFDITVDSFEDERNQVWLPVYSSEENTEPFLLVKHFDDDEMIAFVVNKNKSSSYAIDENNLCMRKHSHIDEKDPLAKSFFKFYHTSDLVLVPESLDNNKKYDIHTQTNLFEKYYDYPLFLQSLSEAFADIQVGSNTYKAAPKWLKDFIESSNIVR